MIKFLLDKLRRDRNVNNKRSLNDYVLVDIKEHKNTETKVKGIKAMKIKGYRDIGDVSKELYNGFIMVINLSDITNKNERSFIEKELKTLINKINGDIAKLNESNYIILTPSNIKIEKIKHDKELAYERYLKREFRRNTS